MNIPLIVTGREHKGFLLDAFLLWFSEPDHDFDIVVLEFHGALPEDIINKYGCFLFMTASVDKEVVHNLLQQNKKVVIVSGHPQEKVEKLLEIPFDANGLFFLEKIFKREDLIGLLSKIT